MIRFTIYTYLFKPIKAPLERNLYGSDVNAEESMTKKLEILDSYFTFDSKFKMKAGGHTYNHHVVARRDDIIVLQIANNSKLVHESNFNRWEEDDHPSLYVLIDNRPGKQIIAIENRPVAFSDTKTVANILYESLNRVLFEYGLEVTIDAKFHTHEFWEVAAECENGVASVRFKFPYPNLAEITDLVGECFTEMALRTNGEPTTTISARPKEHLTLEKDDLFMLNMIKAASASGKLIMMRPVGQRKWKQVGLKTIVHEEISEAVFDHLEEAEIIPRRWDAIVKFLDRIKLVYCDEAEK